MIAGPQATKAGATGDMRCLCPSCSATLLSLFSQFAYGASSVFPFYPCLGSF